MPTPMPTDIAERCAVMATNLRTAFAISKGRDGKAPTSFLACAQVFEEAAAALKAKDGPGTPAGRFSALLDALEQRFHDPEPFSARAPEGRYIDMLDAVLRENAELKRKMKE